VAQEVARRSRRRWAEVLAVLAVLVVALGESFAETQSNGIDPEAAESQTRVRVMLQWRPQSQFAGFYMALAQGMYRAAGLDVELLHAPPNRTSLEVLREGGVEMATAFLSDGIIAAASSADPAAVEQSGAVVPTSSARSRQLVQIAQFVQRSNLMLVAWRDMGIENASDLDGKRVGAWQGAFSATFDTFFADQGVQPVRVPQYGSIGLFLSRAVAACAAMHYHEYHRIWQAGIDSDRLTTFLMRDHGLDLPEDGIFVRSDWLASNRQQARAVREATIAGWDYARTHPEETLDLVLKEARAAGVPTNRPLERWMLEHVLDSIFVPNGQSVAPGVLQRDAFARSARTLESAGLIGRAPRFEEFAPLEGDDPR
jgi:NitT/TauT family transport system substrate-binding protein